jgi:hypothetical protein
VDGARWIAKQVCLTRDHAAGMMNLQAMYESHQAALYWESRRAAA